MRFITKKIPIPEKKKSIGLSKDILKKNETNKLDLEAVKRLRDKKTKQLISKTKFLIDENVLGVDRYLSSWDIEFKKIGDPGCPDLGSDDPTVAKFALQNNLVIVTNDEKLLKQCEALEIECVFMGLKDLAKKVKGYVDSH